MSDPHDWSQAPWQRISGPNHLAVTQICVIFSISLMRRPEAGGARTWTMATGREGEMAVGGRREELWAGSPAAR